MENKSYTKELSFSNRDGKTSLNFNNYDYWESLEDILEILNKFYNVNVIEELEGPDSRILKIQINGNDYSLQYDSYGSFLKSNFSLEDEFLKKIKIDFENSDGAFFDK